MPYPTQRQEWVICFPISLEDRDPAASLLRTGPVLLWASRVSLETDIVETSQNSYEPFLRGNIGGLLVSPILPQRDPCPTAPELPRQLSSQNLGATAEH